jgi:hypothetical protein
MQKHGVQINEPLFNRSGKLPFGSKKVLTGYDPESPLLHQIGKGFNFVAEDTPGRCNNGYRIPFLQIWWCDQSYHSSEDIKFNLPFTAELFIFATIIEDPIQ